MLKLFSSSGKLTEYDLHLLFVDAERRVVSSSCPCELGVPMVSLLALPLLVDLTRVTVLSFTCLGGCRGENEPGCSSASPPSWGAVLGVVPLLNASALLFLGFVFQE